MRFQMEIRTLLKIGPEAFPVTFWKRNCLPCAYPETLWRVQFKGDRVINLMEEISR
jgi:hypothetical protein